MNKSIKILTYAVAVLVVLLACDDVGTNVKPNDFMSSSSNTQSSSSSKNFTSMPAMDSMVVSYKKDAIKYDAVLHYETLNGKGFITDENVLKPAFPHIFDKEQAECNYFAIYFISGSSSPYYWILSQDMILYKIMPASGTLGGTTDIVFDAMLVCDNTPERNLKDKISVDTHNYIDPNWDYDKESVYDRGVCF